MQMVRCRPEATQAPRAAGMANPMGPRPWLLSMRTPAGRRTAWQVSSLQAPLDPGTRTSPARRAREMTSTST